MKKHLSLILLILSAVLLAVIGIYLINSGKIAPQAATNEAVLSLSPSSSSFNLNSTFNIEIIVNSGGSTIDGADVVNLNYPNASLELLKITPGSIFQVTPVKQGGGIVSLVAIVPPGNNGYNGTGTVATLTFKTIGSGTANLTFDFTPGSTRDCNVAEHGTGQDILGSVNNGTYNLTTITETPTSTPTSNSPTGGNTGNGTSSNTTTQTKKTTTNSQSSVSLPTPTTAAQAATAAKPGPAELKVGGFTASLTLGYILYFLIPTLFVFDLYFIWRKIRRNRQLLPKNDTDTVKSELI